MPFQTPPGFDITKLATKRAVEMSLSGISFVTDLPWDVVEGLAAAQADSAPMDPSDAVTFILRDWLATMGYYQLPPDEDGQH
jgi:hypothetical protein